MTTDHSETTYYEAVRDPDAWVWKVYRYDPTGNRRDFVGWANEAFGSREAAEDAASDWCEERGIDAEMA